MRTSKHAHLAIVSWCALLSALAADAGRRGERHYKADVGQLQGLCERIDSEAFLPLRQSELAPEVGKRSAQFADLVDAAVEAIQINPHVSTASLTTGGSHCAYGRYFSYVRLGCILMHSPTLWGRHQ